ncbi:MAG: hypothetical protein WDM81_01325 [Rhizomicrobium sp.]
MFRAAIALAAWLTLFGIADAHPVPLAAQSAATGKPTPIGRMSHDVSPAGFVYTEAPGAPGVPPELQGHKRHRPHPANRGTPRGSAGRAALSH